MNLDPAKMTPVGTTTRHAEGLTAPSTADRRGFTLTEAMVVMVIVLVMTLLAIQGYRSFFQNQTASSSAVKFAKAMTTARYAAMQKGTSHRVTLNLRTNEFWVDKTGTMASEETAPYPNNQTTVDPVSGSTVQVGQGKVVAPEALPLDVIVAETRNVESYTDAQLNLVFIIFRADGTCRTDAVLQFVNQNDDLSNPANYHTVKVYASSGATQTFHNERR